MLCLARHSGICLLVRHINIFLPFWFVVARALVIEQRVPSANRAFVSKTIALRKS
jgi:hypothetical protein